MRRFRTLLPTTRPAPRRSVLAGGMALTAMLLMLAGCLGRHDAMNGEFQATDSPLRLVAACNVNPVPVTVTVRTGPGVEMPVHLAVAECLNKRAHGLTQAGGAGEVLDIRVRTTPAAACRPGSAGCG